MIESLEFVIYALESGFYNSFAKIHQKKKVFIFDAELEVSK